MSDIGYSSTGDDPSVSSMLGGADQSLTTARIGIASDTREIRRIKSEFSTLRIELEKVRKEMQAIEKASKGIRGPRGGQTTGNIGDTPVAGGIFTPAQPGTQDGTSSSLPGVAGQVKAFGGGTTMAVGAGIAQMLTAGIQMAEQRGERGRAHALSADRMSLVYQQMYGLSQQGVVNQYRTPMVQYRLGAGGINALMDMQVTSGIGALQQASSVEAFRAMTGYSVSAGQMSSMISQMASPEVVNRMFMMGGTGLIGPGGKQRSAMQVFQDITRRAGLTDERLLRSALTPGSITRANLSQMGVSGEMQDMVIQYAMQNLEYKKAGGRGMYDPSRKNDRKLMGIEENFAAQAEETDRLRVARDEQFYNRQKDNYADLERQLQSVTRTLTRFEDALSGIIGKTIGSGGYRKYFGIAGTLIGGAIGAFGGPAGVMAGAAIGGAIGQGAAMVTGDPVGNERNNDTQVPFGYGKNVQQVSFSDLSSKSTFAKLHPTMRERLLRMMKDNPKVGIGEGYRSYEAQKAEFLRRYKPTSKKTGTFWNGQYWEHVAGATLAPPGGSMHELGLAADLIGDLDWVVKNAHKYGLKHFANVNNEPWHVQPAELPSARADYEKDGAPWGMSGQSPGASSILSEVSEHGGSLGTGYGTSEGTDDKALTGSRLVGNQSITEKMLAMRAYIAGAQTPGGGKGKLFNTGSGSLSSASSGISGVGGTSVNATPGQNLTGEQVAQLLYNAGFRGQDLIKAVAIAKRESGWRSGALNPDTSTGDESYGLFQINMLGKMGEERLKWFGISSKDALYDPATNIKAMKMMFDAKQKSKGNGWYDWGPYKGMSETYNTDMAGAADIVRSMGLSGDPFVPTRAPGGSGGSVSVNGGPTFNISPNITINGSGNTTDLQRIAKEVARLIEKEVRFMNLRST